jgi:hypothetical protein
MFVTAETAWYGVDMPRSHALLTIPIYILGWPDHRLRLNDQRGGSGRMGSAEQDRIMVDRLYLAWQRAERRSREVPPDWPEAAERIQGVNQLWEAYERALAKAVGRGSLKKVRPG